VAVAKIQSNQSKATTVHSIAKYPAPKVLAAYPRLSDEMTPGQPPHDRVQPTAYHLSKDERVCVVNFHDYSTNSCVCVCMCGWLGEGGGWLTVCVCWKHFRAFLPLQSARPERVDTSELFSKLTDASRYESTSRPVNVVQVPVLLHTHLVLYLIIL
jgi:hypothetical protein